MKNTEKSNRSKLKTFLLYSLIYLVGGFAFAEVFFRLFWIEPPLTYIVQGNDPIYHHVPIAFAKAGLGTYDYRGRTLPKHKNPDTVRVIFFGDSFTYGFTPHDQTIPYHFEQLVKEKFPDHQIEIFNFGFVSYSPIIQRIQYERLVRQLQPDWVLDLFDTCDPIDDAIYRDLAQFDEQGNPTAVVGEEFYNTGLRRSVLIRFIQFAYRLVKNDWHYLPMELRLINRGLYIENPRLLQPMLDYSFDLNAKLAKRAQSDGARTIFFNYPWPFHLRDTSEFKTWLMSWGVQDGKWTTPEERPFSQIWRQECDKRQLTCYDFSPEIRQMEEELGDNSRTAIYNQQDAHFTGKTNKRFARFIFDRLLENGFPQATERDTKCPGQ